MESEEVRRVCREIISRQLDVEEKFILPESLFDDDLGIDSIAIVELTLDAEEQFDIDIPDEDVEKLRTVKDAYEYIERRLLEKPAAGRA